MPTIATRATASFGRRNSKSRLHQAQLEALRSQLNPHFLFNSLHSIAELVHQDPKLAEQLIVRLGELLRRVLESSKSTEVPLGRSSISSAATSRSSRCGWASG